MKKIGLFGAALAALFYCLPATAQNSGAVPANSVPIGKGIGHTGFGSAAPGAAGQALLSTGPSSAPAFGPVAGASFGVQNANKVYAGPSTGADAVPTFRALVAADIPSVTNSMLAGSIAASKLIGTDIATVGTITAGTWNGTTIAVANGGTGATSASSARTNLGVAIGSNVQAWDADLDAFALKTAPSGAVVGTTDVQTLSGKTFDCASNTCTVRLGSDVTGTLPVTSGGTGATSLSAALDSAFSSTQGSILYRGVSGWVALSPGTNGYFLKTQGASSNPVWSAVPGGGDMLASNNLSDLVDKAVSRTNLAVPGLATTNAFTDTTDSSSSTTGAIKIAGGVGIAKNANVGGKLAIGDTTDSTSSSNGAATIAGGLGVAKALNVGGSVGFSQAGIYSGDPRTYPQIQVHTQSGYTIANGGSATITSGDGYYDLDISSTTLGAHCRYLTGNATAVLDATQVNNYCVAPTSSPASGKVSLTWAAGFGYTIYNNSGGSATFRVLSRRTN